MRICERSSSVEIKVSGGAGVHANLPTGKTYVVEVHEELSPMREIPGWSRGRV